LGPRSQSRRRDICIPHTLLHESRGGSHNDALVDGEAFLAHLEDQPGCYRARFFVLGTSRRLRPRFLPSFSFPWGEFGCPAASRRFGIPCRSGECLGSNLDGQKLCCMCTERLGLTVMRPDCNNASVTGPHPLSFMFLHRGAIVEVSP